MDKIPRLGYKTNNWTKVYFIQGKNGGPIKIGHTTNVQKRLNQMQTGNPDELILLYLTHGGKNFEDELHQKFNEFHYRGEWYYPSDKILEFINELKIRDESTKRLYTIVELALAFGEILTNDDKHVLQEVVNGKKLIGEGWGKHKSIYNYYNEYLSKPDEFLEKYKKYLNFDSNKTDST